jgi:hypothetical protein
VQEHLLPPKIHLPKGAHAPRGRDPCIPKKKSTASASHHATASNNRGGGGFRHGVERSEEGAHLGENRIESVVIWTRE